MRNKAYIFFLLAFSIIVKSHCQEIKFENYNIEIQEVVQKKSITSLGQLMFPHSKMKYIGIKAIFIPTSKEKETFDLERLVTKYGGKEYPFLLPNGFAITQSGSGRFISSRKKKKKSIYAEVPKEFSEGILYYDGKKIGEFKFTKNSKKGTFRI